MMRLTIKDSFWVVVNPRPLSELDDILFETDLCGLELQFRGGLTCDENPIIFDNRAEAEVEARERLARR